MIMMNKDQEKLKDFDRLFIEMNRNYQSVKSNTITEIKKKHITNQQFCGNYFHNFNCVCYSDSELRLNKYL